MVQTLDEKVQLLRTAVAELKQVTAIYHDLPRIFCPHILGQMSQQWAVRAWQFDGESSKPTELPMWRNFFLDELFTVTLRDGEWHRGWMVGKRPHAGFDSIDSVVGPEHAAEIRHTSPPRIPGRAPLRRVRKK